MARFSERIGAKPPKTVLQLDSMDDDLRNGLWNASSIALLYRLASKTPYSPYDGIEESLLKLIWGKHLKWRIDTIPPSGPEAYGALRDYFFKATWAEVYDFIEFLGNFNWFNVREFIAECNRVLQEELSGYRFVGQQLARITNEQEMATVQAALELPSKLKPVNLHIQTAVNLFSDRKAPDYRNSIKESISAVEAICQIITGDPKATLGQALKRLEDAGVKLHAALKNSFNSLYGYTNDAHGIRHAMGLLDEPVDFDDAKFMLVSCSAFVNYLATKASKAGVI